ncbi:hypothetical protein SAY87_021144 [Trapa incisa]|uniref:C2 and GRAM domain-containing protein n=1 Tax=Trapa incisa TaxID=236973 RepID=A0AAN7JRC2_9MYRT|nr:hypothetical protein SAY87_021144 [Trapa incisa]
MKLYVRVIEARNLPAMDLNGLSDPYVKLQLGKHKIRTKVVKKNLNPSWGEEFSFRVEDLKEELVVSVLDEDKYFSDDFVGQLKIPVSQVFDADNGSLGTAWYTLQPKHKKSKKECGEILLAVNFASSRSYAELNGDGGTCGASMRKSIDGSVDSASVSFSSSSTMPSPARGEEVSSREEKSCPQRSLAGRLAHIFSKASDSSSSTTTKALDPPEVSESAIPEFSDVQSEEQSSSGTFEEVIKVMESRDQEGEVPSNLPGGVLLDQMYVISPSDLNALLFSPESSFQRSLADLQGTTELQLGSWKFENGEESLKRVVTYIKAASKLIKAVKGTEDQVYLKANGNVYAVLAAVSTPDVPYGGSFKTEIQYCITPGSELPSGEQSSRLVISWRMNFIQSTIMKGMIENGARQGLKDSYEQYAGLLAQTIKPVDSKDIETDKDQILATIHAESQSDWKLAVQYLANFTVLSSFIMGLYAVVHLCVAGPNMIRGLEFVGLDLPDSIGEFIVGGILVLQAERVLGMISRFMKARAQKGSDHGVKAQGDGWLLTVALIEGNNLAAVDASGFSDPYVVFTCNGKTKTSSIKFQKIDPLWNEIFEFDAMDDPPSVLDVEVFDFDGPFDEATSLGHAEINFVRANISELADVWIPLNGKLATACQSKLHLRIFLNNTRGSNIAREYIRKMEKEVGKKINVRSPQTNSAFQKLFGLPPEEFLINDFTCHLKRKMPLQGRLFLSARIIGFHANLFGHKTKFYFLWEDIEDIKVLSPTLSSMGSPIILMILRQGRGSEARHGAKTQDEEGRLKYYFQSFVSFGVAHRTIMALWRARALTPEQKAQIVEEESEGRNLQSEESGSILDLEDVSLSEVYSSIFPVPIGFLMEVFRGGDMEHRIMEAAGCVNYSMSPWESEKPEIYERHIYYRFDKRISRYRGEATCTQQKYPLSEKSGWIIEEVMTLHGVPLGDYFTLHLKYQVEESPSRPKACNVQVFFGIAWLKSSRHQKRVTKNILQSLQERIKIMFSVLEKEFSTVNEGETALQV